MKHLFTSFEGKRYYVLTCDHCHRADLPPDANNRRVVARGGRWLCDECWDYERELGAESSLFVCSTCGTRRTAVLCAGCLLTSDET